MYIFTQATIAGLFSPSKFSEFDLNRAEPLNLQLVPAEVCRWEPGVFQPVAVAIVQAWYQSK